MRWGVTLQVRKGVTMTPERIAVILGMQRVLNESPRGLRTTAIASLRERRQDMRNLRERVVRPEGLFEGFAEAPAMGNLTRA